MEQQNLMFIEHPHKPSQNKMQVRLVSKTTGAPGTEYEGKSLDEIIVGQARISSSRELNELFDEPHKLIRHCISLGHWSIFSLVDLNLEITTSRFISRELLRHWSIKPTEFSQRYAEVTEFEPIELRLQGESNRQGGEEIYDGYLNTRYQVMLNAIEDIYRRALKAGISRESARVILPECAQTKLCMKGGVREWITMLNVRLHKTAQKEMRVVANEIKDVFIQQCPIVSKALFDFEDAEQIHILDRVILEKYNLYQPVKDNNFKPVQLSRYYS
jgi:thymidylate synthase (FAD)